MSSNLYVATRKGLFTVARSDGFWHVVGDAFMGSPVSMVLPDPLDGCLYAALDLGHFGAKLHRSDDQGGTWTEVAMPAYAPADEGEEDGSDAPAVKLAWALESAGTAGALWCGTIPGGLFRSDDRGETWALNEPLWTMPAREKWFGGGADQPGIHSICVDPRDTSRVSVAVSCGGVWETTDGGASWAARSKGMFAEYMPPDQADAEEAQDPHRMVQCASAPDTFWVQHHNGVFRSTDNLGSWSEITAILPDKFGFAVAVHPYDPETAWFVPAVKDEYRYPRDGRFVVACTHDGGRSFDVHDVGLPAPPAYDLVYRHGLAVDATGDVLAMGSTTGGLWVSEDGGTSWTCVSAHMPPIYAVRWG